ncbi:acyl-ACP thioesterase [Paenibacillus sp. JCM 10914]|nr:acyl-ACP thioesterase [Paenibacillus sp. JCM 10914]
MEALGISRDEMIHQGMGWMLITLGLDMKRIPRDMETMDVETWSKGAKGALWHRDYRITNSDGELLGEARSVWALVDIQKRKILRPSMFPYEVPVVHEAVGEALHKTVLPEGVQLTEAYSHLVRYSGIDPNGHLNNARYADLCFDALDEAELQEGRVKGFRITYHHEARLRDNMVIKRSVSENNTVYILGTSPEGTNFFEAAIVREP